MSGEGLSADVERLAEAMCNANREPHMYRGRHDATRWGACEAHEEAARWLLASDWLARRESEAAEKALRDAAELVSDANAQGLGLGAAYRSILREADSVAQGREEGGK